MSYIQAEIKKIGKNINIGPGTIIISKKLEIKKNVIISDNVKLIGKEIVIGSNSKIQKDVSIISNRIIVGEESVIEHNLQFSGCGSSSEKSQAEEFITGDNIFIGFGSRITVPIFHLGDYSILHNNLSFYGNAPLKIGHNAWIGQYTLINTRKAVTIGNNVGMGPITQIWTHSARGESIEGSTIFSEKEVILEDNTWLNGGVIISPGVRTKSWSVVLIGSVVTKNTEDHHIYAGIPARDITDRIKPYKIITLEEKYEIMKKLVNNYISKRQEHSDKIFLFNNPDEVPSDIPKKDAIIIFKDAKGNFNIKKNSVFDIKTKKYRKRRSSIEIDFIKANLGHNARFIPL